jgi:hypothetical protein
MNDVEQLTSNRLWIAVINLDLQLYKASIYKQRWGTPGGLDQAMPCYDEALRVIDGTSWPEGIQGKAQVLRRRLEKFKVTLGAKDVTTASAEQTRLMYAFEDVREAVRYWPAEPPAGALGLRTGRDAMDETLPSM